MQFLSKDIKMTGNHQRGISFLQLITQDICTEICKLRNLRKTLKFYVLIMRQPH